MDDKVFEDFSAEASLNVEPISNRRYFAGLDWGEVGGHAAIVVMDAEESCIVAIDRFQEYNWSSRQQHILEAYKRWNWISSLAKRNSVYADIDDLWNMGIPIRPISITNRTKNRFVESFAHALRRREVRIPSDELLLQQLNHFRVIPLKNGNYRLSVDRGFTEELVIASALALSAVRQTGPLIDFA